ncbi:hypothetical protein F4779DRAFT_619046 [Xylariaceae sp. FL0662B]|nr:hypothetical protein F4779DRAFT_619046 [Xylariaceae sp. FL0662B]
MVGFVGRFKKPKSVVVLGSPGRDGTIPPSEVPATSQHPAPPVLRNFSYPTSVGTSARPPPSPPESRAEQTPWDQLGEICNFSPNSISRAGQDRTRGLEDPFFFKSERGPYSRLVDQDERFGSATSSDRLLELEPQTQDEPKARKKQRRSNSVDKSGPRDEISKHPKGYSLGDVVPQKLKRSSLCQHKVAASFDASQLIVLPFTSPSRPMSSSGVPLVDTRFKRPTSKSKLQFPLPQESKGDFSTHFKEVLVSPVSTSMQLVDMDPVQGETASYSPSGLGNDTSGSWERTRRHNDSTSESRKHKGKDGKSRWFSQLKDWISVSEPSSQAFKHYKKDTYRKAGIALDDPQANAKLHLPVGALPPNAIKPAGPGSDPEEIVMKRAEQRKKSRQSYVRTVGMSQHSQSSASHYSSSSSIAFSATKEDAQ